MRLIDADALKFDIMCVYGSNPKYINWLNHAPTVDAVPVVRCRDCRYYGERMASGFWSCNRKEGCTRTLPEGFCGWGIPR